ncbi:MAG: hypothetical protein HFJ50_02365 [Clostridia bacterium]|nr:hypothetical protein [Clostridia bacterium]
MQIPEIGVNGAAIASSLNNIVVFLVSYLVLNKTIKLNLKPRKFIIKPLIATIIMSVCSYTLYMVLTRNIAIRKNCNNYFIIICSSFILCISNCFKNI